MYINRINYILYSRVFRADIRYPKHFNLVNLIFEHPSHDSSIKNSITFLVKIPEMLSKMNGYLIQKNSEQSSLKYFSNVVLSIWQRRLMFLTRLFFTEVHASFQMVTNGKKT